MRKGLDVLTCSQGYTGPAEQTGYIRGRTFPRSHQFGVGEEAGLSIPEGIQASKPTKGIKNTNILLMIRKMSQQLKSVLIVHSWVPQLRFCLFVLITLSKMYVIEKPCVCVSFTTFF